MKNKEMINEIFMPEINEQAQAEHTEPKKPSGGYRKIADYVRNISPEQRAENSRKGQAKQAEHRRRDANFKKAIEKWASAKLPATREAQAKILEELGLPISQLQAAVQGVGDSAINGNPKSLETLAKIAGQIPTERMSVAITENQMDENQMRALFGVFSKNEDEEE